MVVAGSEENGNVACDGTRGQMVRFLKSNSQTEQSLSPGAFSALGKVCLSTLVCVALLWASTSANADQNSPQTPAAFVRNLLEKADGQMDYAHIKLAIDHYVDPSVDENAVLAELDQMRVIIDRMLGTLSPEKAATSMEKMKALRAFIYEPGKWNDNKPFQYNMADPYGLEFKTRLLSNYLATRKGNCISMPMLFLILGERLGLDVTLSTAPLHVFVKYTDDATGTTYNLETTSGAGATREMWYQKKAPMTEQAIANGVYMKKLSRKQTISVMATLVMEDMLETKRYEDAIAVADVLLEVWPEDAYTLIKKGTAYYKILEENFIKKYPDERDIPADKLPEANRLHQANLAAFEQAGTLGWTQPVLQ
ncbi:transglutaminase family protein [Phyllobacterium myrsinacearum]|nr:transglutaminase family protein [Phyllobacterium myrsinacearum]